MQVAIGFLYDVFVVVV